MNGRHWLLPCWLAAVSITCTALQVLRRNGVEPFRPEGEKFDPNQHEALFQLPDPSKEPGTVGVVTKVLPFFLPMCWDMNVSVII